MGLRHLTFIPNLDLSAYFNRAVEPLSRREGLRVPPPNTLPLLFYLSSPPSPRQRSPQWLPLERRVFSIPLLASNAQL